MTKRILIVEDDTQIDKVYLEKFGKEGYAIDIALAGDEALTKLAGNVYDLVILDIMLPGHMNGFDVLEKMKRDEKQKTIPVIVLTNLDSEEKTAKEIGANMYLVKSNISIEEVFNKVKSFLI
jgi:DNA-binding response OmpR family regulator